MFGLGGWTLQVSIINPRKHGLKMAKIEKKQSVNKSLLRVFLQNNCKAGVEILLTCILCTCIFAEQVT